MSKLLIDKEKLEARIAELEKERFYGSELNSDYRIGQQQAYKEILQQGEEYNENEAIELRKFGEWLGNSRWNYYPKINVWYNTDLKKELTTWEELYKLYKNERNS